MAEEHLEEAGLYLDEITKKLHLIDPERSKLTESLLKHIEDFQGTGVELVESLAEVLASMEKMGQLVDSARQKIFGAESALLLESIHRERDERDLSNSIRDKVTELERNRSYIESLVRQKNDILEFIYNMNK